MTMYLVLSVASLFLSFNTLWLSRKILLIISSLGILAAFTHRAGVDCSGPINKLDPFNFLGCVGGYGLSWLASVASLLIIALAVVQKGAKGVGEQ